MDFGTCLEHRQEKSIECPICVIEERDQLRAEVERLRAEKETLTTTVRALREACESALSYFRAAWTETGHHPASHYADYVDELAEAIGK